MGAGESRRMGTQKLLIEIREKPMLGWVVSSFQQAVDDIVVVLGHRPEVLIPLLRQLGVKWTINVNYRDGMITSIKEGLKMLKECDAVFVALGDQPLVDVDFLKKAIETWRKGARIVCPIVRGKKGHPVLFDKSLFDEILALSKDQFLRDVIHRHKDELKTIEAEEWAITDIDTPEGLEAFKRKF
ncbi:MAG: nucleotidyltransferase family protein [Candidatus Hadarchaeum sp.]|uniref:nucleotidyltransferase family protein n=1 Tax=Candidatus Hadarchaeum sp. TaxID=2883567 RepID=UPI003D0DFD58